MAKGSRGGKRTTVAASAINSPRLTQQVTPPTLQQIAAGNVLPQGGVPFSQFEGMTDDQKADVISNALGQALPFFLDDSDLQKLAYFTGLNDKPTLMNEQQIKALPGQDLWRSVHSSYDRNTDIGYTSQDIYNQIATGDFTRYSDSGGSAYGKAIYFDTQKGSYGSGKGFTVMHAKFLPTAKVIDYATLQSQWAREASSGSKLARAIKQADHASRPMLYAMAKGYDAVQNGSYGYRMVLNRRAIALSTKTF